MPSTSSSISATPGPTDLLANQHFIKRRELIKESALVLIKGFIFTRLYNKYMHVAIFILSECMQLAGCVCFLHAILKVSLLVGETFPIS